MKLLEHEFGSFFEDESIFIFFSNKHSIKFLNSFSKKTLFTKQVHETRILKVDNIKFNTSQETFSTSILENADAMTSNKRNIALGIQTADCVPCFLISKDQIFSLHLGWRSLVNGLLDKALKNFSKSESLRLFIGPHIQEDSFEVGKEVVDEFSTKNNLYDGWHSFKNDMNKISLLNVIKQKCSLHQIDILSSEVDTFTDQGHHSYRRAQKSGEKSLERNISVAYFK